MILDRDYYRRNQTDAMLALKQDLDEKNQSGGYVGVNDSGSVFMGASPVTFDSIASLSAGSNITQSGNNGLQSGSANTQSGDNNTQSGSDNIQSGNNGLQSGSANTQSGYYGLQSGSANTQSGNNGLQSGSANTQTGYNSTQSGSSNTQTGDSGLQSGYNNTQSGNNGLQSGDSADDFGLYSARTHAAGRFAASGDAQIIELVARRSTTNATPAELFLDGSSLQCVLQNDSTYFFSIEVAARRTDADGESAAYKLEGCIDRNANAASTALVGTVLKTVLAEDNTAWDVSATADTTNGALALTVTGEAAKTIYWVSYIKLVKVTG